MYKWLNNPIILQYRTGTQTMGHTQEIQLRGGQQHSNPELPTGPQETQGFENKS